MRGLLKKSVTKISHEAGKERASETVSESVALLSEPDLGCDFTHTLEQSFTVSQPTHVCFAQIEMCEVMYVTHFVDARFFQSNTRVSWLQETVQPKPPA